ncbi:acyl-CoA N-acyltransferase [Wallemia mellicola]|uniref:Acyl-CoA N-acyltransferase n=1 Tax=Wallemia mellicola TaxID=1708541 RepID=A0A4T0MDA7_9BASI|nr:acyl-CoA N-acyltransferase [Wallemia mellicola]TIC16092.1 acyl-CoA N-acyltransferase [Wallemia mellicola]
MSNIKVEICKTQAEIEEAFNIRLAVFTKEYDQVANELIDDILDNHAIQLLARDEDGSAVGSVRLQPYPQDIEKLEARALRPATEEETVKLFDGIEGGRFANLAVKPSARNKGVAATLIKFCEDYINARAKPGTSYIRFRSHYRIHPLYIAKFGYAVDSERFTTSWNQDLVWMYKKL